MHRFTKGGRLVAMVTLVASSTVFQLATSSAAARSSCHPGDTEILLGAGDAGLGHWGRPLLIVDPGAQDCAFTGYPVVRVFESPSKRWVTARRDIAGYLGGLRSGQHIQRVALGVDNVASFFVEGTDVPVGGASTCQHYVRIEVALPGWPVSANLPFSGLACSTLQVHPIVLGPTGDQPPV